jgi:hypothetical protein
VTGSLSFFSAMPLCWWTGTMRNARRTKERHVTGTLVAAASRDSHPTPLTRSLARETPLILA